jgi:hypothetical protein
MALPCHVYMEEQGLIGGDDGTAAWHKTLISLLVAGRVVNGYLLHEWYAGHKTLRARENQFGLDGAVAQALLLEVYKVSSVTMRMFSCDVGEAVLDLEPLIQDLFYGSVTARAACSIT